MIYEWSRTGEYHRETFGENQDCVRSEEHGGNTVITLADGVSACSRAKEGAATAADAITRLLAAKGSLLMELESERIAGVAVAHIQFELGRKAKQDEQAAEEYSSTVASVLLSREKNRLLCFSLGDSMIIAVSNGRSRILTLPYDSSDGCCVTTTEGCEKEAVVKMMDTEGIDSVVICSDGAWREMFDRNRLKSEVEDILTSGSYEQLGEYLENHGSSDDSSFIAMDINGRRAA